MTDWKDWRDATPDELRSALSATPPGKTYRADPDRGPRTRRIYARKAKEALRPDIRKAYGKTVLYATWRDADGNVYLSDEKGNTLCVSKTTPIEAIMIFLESVTEGGRIWKNCVKK